MLLTNKQKIQIQQLIINCLLLKVQKYNFKLTYMPFYFSVFERIMVLHLFIRLLNSKFSILELAVKSLTQFRFLKVELKQIVVLQIMPKMQFKKPALNKTEKDKAAYSEVYSIVKKGNNYETL